MPTVVHDPLVKAFASPTGVSFADGGNAFVTLCHTVNLTNAMTDVPFYDELVRLSGCSIDGNSQTMALTELEAAMESETAKEAWHWPSGIIIHAMRVGSTAAANMVGAHPEVVVVKESGVLTDVLTWPVLGTVRQRRQQQQLAVRALRVSAQLFFRSAASQQLGVRLNAGDSFEDARARASQTRIVFKMSSAGTASSAQLGLLREAFPDAPFAYLVREPVASVASLIGHSQPSHELLDTPCLRWRGRPAWAQLPTLLARANTTDPLSLTIEQYCAAYLGALHEGMLAQISNDGGLADARRRSLVLDHSAMPSVVVRELMPHFDLVVDASVQAEALEHGALNAKNPSKRGYRRTAPTEATARWATAYALPTYTRLLWLSSWRESQPLGAPSAEEALATAEAAAAAAARNASASAGRYAHTAGLHKARPVGRNASGRAPAVSATACSMATPSLSHLEVAELGAALLRRGDLLGAERCWLNALERAQERQGMSATVVTALSTARAAILTNLATVESILSRQEARRVVVFPRQDSPMPDEETVAAARRMHSQITARTSKAVRPERAASDDPAIGVYDGVLSDELCAAIVELFDGAGASEHYIGNVGTGSGFEVKPDAKLDTEIDISHSPRALWDAIDSALLQGLLGALDKYAAANLGLLPPFQWTDEGFRLKRYSKVPPGEPPHHHSWHADAGSASEGSGGTACRGVAVLFYFNDVDVRTAAYSPTPQPSPRAPTGHARTHRPLCARHICLTRTAQVGGETVFMSPRPFQVQPRRGRLLIFPASFSYFHAGAAPISHPKYIASNFASACSRPEDSTSFRPLPVLPVERRQALRALLGSASPANWRATADQLLRASGEDGVASASLQSVASLHGNQGGRAGALDPHQQNLPAYEGGGATAATSAAQCATAQEESGEADTAPAVPAAREAGAEPDRSTAALLASDQCGDAFTTRVSEELGALQEPADCTTARLVVCGSTPKDFEGLGSVVMQMAHAQAEGYYSNRTLIWGPRATHPPFFAGAECVDGQGRGQYGHACYFEPLSHCSWEAHVFREEAQRFDESPFSDTERVTLQNVLRGALAMYTAPAHLVPLLPEATQRDAAAVAECWAGALVARVFRLVPSMAGRVAQHAQALLSDRWQPPPNAEAPSGSPPGLGHANTQIGAPRVPLGGVHLRMGDVSHLADVYTNREVPSIAQLAASVRRVWSPDEGLAPPASARVLLYLATDAPDARTVASKLRQVSGVEDVVFFEAAFRTPHGSHSAAFAADALRGDIELTLPYEDSRLHASRKDQKERVRHEAIIELTMLSVANAGMVAAASSTFAVTARLLGVGMQRAPQLASGMLQFTDLEGVASGELATGYMRGMRNGTHRMADGGERRRVALARFLGRSLRATDPPLRFDPRTAIPLTPTPLVRRAATSWGGTVLPSGSECVCNPLAVPHAAPDESQGDVACDAVHLTNDGAKMHDGFLMNWAAAQRCWRRAIMLPGRTREAAFTQVQRAGEVADIARENLQVLLAAHHDHYQVYRASAAGLHVRGGVHAGRTAACATAGGARRLRVHLEGWRGVSHSYSIVASHLLVELASRCALELSWSDVPMPAGFQGALASTRPPLPSGVAHLAFGEVPAGASVLRLSWPYNLIAPAAEAAHAIVFATAEHLACPEEALAAVSDGGGSEQVTFLTPTQWSLEGLVACGIRRDRIGIAPHGAPPSLLSESAERAAASLRVKERRARGWAGRFVLLHVGAATPNKNLNVLVAAYAAMLRRYLAHPESAEALARLKRRDSKRRDVDGHADGPPPPLLVLKGLDALYGSHEATEAVLRSAFAGWKQSADAVDWREYVQLEGSDLPDKRLAALYRAADAYVSASMAEGFQMPLAEATAAGLPVIVPSGGAAEEVVHWASAEMVPSVVIPRRPALGGVVIHVDQEQLAQAIEAVHTNRSAHAPRARLAGPVWARKKLSMAYSADLVLAELMKRKHEREADM